MEEIKTIGGYQLPRGADGGHYTPVVTQPTADTMMVEFQPSKAGMPGVEPVEVKLPVGSGNGSGQIPDPVQADWGQNDPTQPDYVKHRTHWEENNQTVIEWDGNTEGRDSVVLGSGTFVKVSDMTPDTTELAGANLRMSMGGQEMEKPIADVQTGDGCYLAEGVVLVVQCAEIAFGEYSAMAPSTGVYFMSVGAALSLTYGSTVVHPLAEKWIPDSVKLPAGSADNNGAFLRVVDGVWTAVKLTDVSTEGA